MKTLTRLFFIAMLLAGLCFVALPVVSLTGCNTSQQAAVLQGTSATDASVRLAMTGWGLYVSQKHPGTNAETQVLIAFNAVKNAELGVIDAAASVQANPLATNAATVASIVLSNAQVSLVNLISTYTNTLK